MNANRTSAELCMMLRRQYGQTHQVCGSRSDLRQRPHDIRLDFSKFFSVRLCCYSRNIFHLLHKSLLVVPKRRGIRSIEKKKTLIYNLVWMFHAYLVQPKKSIISSISVNSKNIYLHQFQVIYLFFYWFLNVLYYESLNKGTQNEEL